MKITIVSLLCVIYCAVSFFPPNRMILQWLILITFQISNINRIILNIVYGSKILSNFSFRGKSSLKITY